VHFGGVVLGTVRVQVIAFPSASKWAVAASCQRSSGACEISHHPTIADTSCTTHFDADGKAITCTLTVPSTTPPKCTDSRAYVYQLDGRIQFLSLDGNYEKVSVTMLHEGTLIADQSFAVKYTNTELNGPGCGPARRWRHTQDRRVPDRDAGTLRRTTAGYRLRFSETPRRSR